MERLLELNKYGLPSPAEDLKPRTAAQDMEDNEGSKDLDFYDLLMEQQEQM